MKKKNLLLTGLFAAIATVAMTGCEIHIHTYSDEWSADETHHWHAATCDDTDRVLGDAEHTFGEWEGGENVCSAGGREVRVCVDCGYEDVHEIEGTGEHSYTEQVDFFIEEGIPYYTMECVCGAKENVVATDVYVVTPSNAQSVLDGEAGSLDGKTVYFTQGEYTETLILGRPTVHEGSNTTYKGMQGETEITSLDEIKAMTWGTRHYTRTLRDITFTGEEGVVLPGMTMSSGHVHGSGYDYVLNQEYNGSGYFLTHVVEDLTFVGLSFDGNVDFNTSQAETSMEGLYFVDCAFDLGGTESEIGAAIRIYSEYSTEQLIVGVTVENCQFSNVYQGVYTQHVKDITVRECTFNTTGHNAVAVQTHGDTEFDHGAVVICDNEFANIGDRVIRFNTFGGTSITITGNVATNSGDEAGEVIKATTLAEGVAYTINNNDWGEGKIVANPEFEDAQTEE